MDTTQTKLLETVEEILADAREIPTLRNPFVIVSLLYEADMRRPQNEYVNEEYDKVLRESLPQVLLDALGEDLLRLYARRTLDHIYSNDIMAVEELLMKIMRAFNKVQLRLFLKYYEG